MTRYTDASGPAKRRGPIICGQCKGNFKDEAACEHHIRDTHKGKEVGIYKRIRKIDLRDVPDPMGSEPSIADQSIDASLRRAMGEDLDDCDTTLADMADGQ